jgi:hypothetical protein
MDKKKTLPYLGVTFNSSLGENQPQLSPLATLYDSVVI